MLKKLIKNYQQRKQEKLINKPIFKIGDLFVSEIVLYKKREHIGPGEYLHHYKEIKKLAFFYLCDYDKYRHIISGQDLRELGSYYSSIGDYAILEPKKFQEAFPIFMRRNKFDESTKVSLQFIINNEESLNKELDPNQKVNEIFQYNPLN